MTTPPSQRVRSALRTAAPYIGLGFQMAATLALFTGGGYGLDLLWGTDPWLLLAGATVGAGAVLTQLIRIALRPPQPPQNPSP